MSDKDNLENEQISSHPHDDSESQTHSEHLTDDEALFFSEATGI